MMRVRIKEYDRWDERCNWQLQSREEKDLPKTSVEDLEFLGFKYNARYNEYHLQHENRLTIIAIL